MLRTAMLFIQRIPASALRASDQHAVRRAALRAQIPVRVRNRLTAGSAVRFACAAAICTCVAAFVTAPFVHITLRPTIRRTLRPKAGYVGGGRQNPPCCCCHKRNLSVANGLNAVQFVGHPISHSIHVGFGVHPRMSTRVAPNRPLLGRSTTARPFSRRCAFDPFPRL